MTLDLCLFLSSTFLIRDTWKVCQVVLWSLRDLSAWRQGCADTQTHCLPPTPPHGSLEAQDPVRSHRWGSVRGALATWGHGPGPAGLCPWARISQRWWEWAGEGRTRFSLYLDQAVTKSSRILSSFRELIFWIQVFLRWGDVVKKLFIMEFILGSNGLPAQYQKGSEKALQWW